MISPPRPGAPMTTSPVEVRSATHRRSFIAAMLVFVLLVAGCSASTGNDGDSVAAIDDAESVEVSAVDEATAKEVLVVTGSKNPGVTVTSQDGEQTADSAMADETTTTGQGTTTTETSAPGQTTPETQPATSRAFPDCSAGCNYVMEGDSITFNLSQWLWPKFCTDVSAATCVNSGISGHRIDQMMETARNDVDIHLGSGSNDVLIFWGGTNDLWQKFHSDDPAEGARGAYESTKAYIAERREKGWDYVVILTHPPMNDAVVAGWPVLNDLIRQNEAGADTVIDVAPDPKLADPFDPVMKSPDGVHYKDPGRQVVVEEYLIPTIKELSNR